jgi:uncharacterized protein YacL
MNWSEISSAVGKDAPLLGTVLAGRAGGAVGPLVAAALGTEATPEAVSAVLASPEAAVRLRRIETAHRAKLQEIQLEQTRAELADVADARARDVALVQAGRNNRRADVMVLIDAVGLIACLVVLVLFRSALPEGAATLISTIASIFGLCLRDAHSFEFGSSRSSQVKDATIRELAK